MTPVLYTQRHKAHHHMAAMVMGFPADHWSLDKGTLAPGDDVLHIVGGLQFGALDRMKEIRAAGKPFIFYDRAYFGGGPRSDRLRITASGYQQHWLSKHADRGHAGRLRGKWGIELQPWRASGRHILLVPPSHAVAQLFYLDAAWLSETIARLQAVTDRTIMISLKGDPVPLADRLRDCWCVVTYTSNVAVDAIVAGVPAFVSVNSAAQPVAGYLSDLERDIEAPPTPDRQDWAEGLSWGQFDLEEVRSGFAREVVMEEFDDFEARATGQEMPHP